MNLFLRIFHGSVSLPEISDEPDKTAVDERRQSRRASIHELWLSWTEWPLLGISILFLVGYAVEVIGNLRGNAAAPWDIVLNVTWALFGIDYVVRLVTAPSPKRWFVRNLIDLLILLLPFFRPLRLVRTASMLHRKAGAAFRGRVVVYVITSTLILVTVASLGVLDAEQNEPGANLRSFGDALWWSVVTITSVGYGDYYPITLQGRLIAVGLMVAGLALIGSVTATFASWFIEQIRAENPTREEPRARLEEENDR